MSSSWVLQDKNYYDLYRVVRPRGSTRHGQHGGGQQRQLIGLGPGHRPAATVMSADKIAKGIYEIKEDTLHWCSSAPGIETRPTEFAAPEGSMLLFVTLKREKK
ncbi:MAG TPA: hypothetical protein VKE98_18125 [Gemmataceae bacterium]|nr:hypothetical protein [Gemmataceae bacterium]